MIYHQIKTNQAKELEVSNYQYNGVAGSGKTRKMVEIALELAEQNSILVICFNKKLQTELSSVLYHENITVSTFHGLANKHNTRKIGYPFSYSSIKKLTDLNNRESTVLSKILTLYTSSEYTINEFIKNLFNSELKEYVEEIKCIKNSDNKETDLLNLMVLVIKDYHDNNSTNHDLYLKEYQLSKPKVNYDYVFVDEYQDLNPVMVDIIEGYNKPLYIFGDKNQKIYSFRNSTGIFSKPFTQYELIKTNRCPTNIVEYANRYLDILGTSMESNIKGGEVVIYDQLPVIKENTTVISNYNFSAVETVLYYGEKVNLVLDIDIKISQIQDMYNFVNKIGIPPNHLKYFTGEESLIKFYKETENMSMLTALKCAKMIKSWEQFEGYLSFYDESLLVLTITNVFIAKGLEWDNVIIADDFEDINEAKNQLTYDPIRFIYVAMTRAKKRLHLPEYLSIDVKPKYRFLEDSSDIIQQKVNELKVQKNK